jgi:hypothetical protein
MRGIPRSLVVVCLFVVSVGVFASPRDAPRGGDIVKRIVKRVKALNDLLTIPVPAPKP